MKIKLLYLLLVITWSIPAMAQDGAISNIVVNHRTDGSGYVDIYYNLSGSGNCYQVSAEVSFNNGSTYSAIASNYLTGNAGPTAPGNNKHMVWNGKGSHNNTYSAQTRIRLQASSGTTVTIGTGTTAQGWPYYTYYMDSRTQMLYTASEITAGGGSAGAISTIGFNVSTRASQAMNGFQIKMKNTTATSLSSGWQTGLTTVYSGTYTVPATGWQMITLQTPFNWSGSNLVIEICYNNSSYSSNSTVYCTSVSNMTQHNHFDGSATSGCDATTTGIQSYRPNLRLTMSCTPSNPAGFTIGSGGSCANTQVNGAYVTGNALSASNYVTIQATVTSPGSYTINTNTVNGFSFSGSGSFASAGAQMVTLAGTGTPLSASNSVLTATGSNLGGTCTFNVTVTAPQYGVPCPGMPTVTYAGKVYNTVQIGTQCWLKENLNVGTRINGSQSQTNNGVIDKYCYNDLESNCDIYGGLYQWDEAMQYVITAGVQGICPAGWHLPSDAEWTTLTTYLEGESVAGGKMKQTGYIHWNSPNTGATNESNFTSLGAGHMDVTNPGSFANLYIYNYNWSSTIYYTDHAWQIGLKYDVAQVYRLPNGRGDGSSVRCIHD